MPYEQSEEEKKYWKDLEENFDSKVEEYEDSVKEKSKEELSAELNKHEDYMAIYERGEVSDNQLNVRFRQAKIKVLRRLLESF